MGKEQNTKQIEPKEQIETDENTIWYLKVFAELDSGMVV
jgi:hypothetical protein